MKIFTSYIVTERGAKVAPLPKFLLRFGAVLLICIGAFCLAGAAGDAWLLRIGLSLAFLVCAALGEFEARSSIEFTNEGVLLLNGWRKKTVSWSRFDRFAVPTPRLGYRVGRVLTTDGESIRSQLLTPNNRLGRGEKSVERAVEELNEAAANAHRGQPGGRL